MNISSRLAIPGAEFFQLPGVGILRTKHTVIYIVLALTVVFFGDNLLPILAHGLILFLEVIEAVCDHILESVFHFSSWTSQLITAWSGFFILVLFTAVIFRRIRKAMRALRARMSQWLDGFHA